MEPLRSAAAIALTALISPAFAADFDGAKDLICASQVAIDCTRDGECSDGLPDSFNIPQMFSIGFRSGTIEATRPDNSQLRTEIKTRTIDAERLILQGFENGRGWTASISQQTGNLVITASGEDVGFIVFGACVARP